MKSFIFFLLFFRLAVAEEPKIVVVGAGLAGLSAAHRIEALTGYSVDLFEARERPGGRVWTIYFGDSYEEAGGKFLSDGGEAKWLRALIAEMGLEVEAYSVPLRERKYVLHEQVSPYYAPFRKGMIPDAMTLSSLKERALKAQNLGELLDAFFRGQPLLRFLSEVRMRGYEGNDTCNLDPFYLSSFWNFYSEAVFLSEDSVVKVDYIKGGNSLLVEKLVASLKNPIHYEAPLRRISKEKDKILLHFDGIGAVFADLVVLAIPCSTLKDVKVEEDLLPPDQREAIASLQYGTNGKILIPISLGEGENSEFSMVEDLLFWFNRGQTLMTLYSGGSKGDFDPASAVEEWERKLPSLKRLYPNLSALAPPLGISWVREEYSKGSYSSWAPGQWEFFNKREEHLAELVRRPFRPAGEIFFAGEHTALEAPATMEGAVESGERAARMICNWLTQQKEISYENNHHP